MSLPASLCTYTETDDTSLPPSSCNPFDSTGDAMDVIVVSNPENNTAAACSDFVVRFGTTHQDVCVRLRLLVGEGKNDKIYDSSYVEGFDMSFRRDDFLFCEGRSTKPSHDSLQRLLGLLKKGRNRAQYVLFTASGNKCLGVADFNIYHWSCQDRVVVCDIDGTITKSNVRGVLDTVLLERHEYAHEGVCSFLSQLIASQQDVCVLYLTSRPISLAQSTRDFLSQLVQKDCSRLPEGPLFCHSGHLGQVLFSELVWKDTHQYKADVLFRQVVLPFAVATQASSSRNESIWCAGFGNNMADAMAYEMAGMPRRDIYIIDKYSKISCIDKNVSLKQGSRKSNVTTRTESMSSSSSSSSPCNGHEDHSPSKIHSSRRQGLQQMKAVRRKCSYRRLIGTTFLGYEDPQLLPIVQAKLTL